MNASSIFDFISKEDLISLSSFSGNLTIRSKDLANKFFDLLRSQNPKSILIEFPIIAYKLYFHCIYQIETYLEVLEPIRNVNHEYSHYLEIIRLRDDSLHRFGIELFRVGYENIMGSILLENIDVNSYRTRFGTKYTYCEYDELVGNRKREMYKYILEGRISISGAPGNMMDIGNYEATGVWGGDAKMIQDTIKEGQLFGYFPNTTDYINETIRHYLRKEINISYVL